MWNVRWQKLTARCICLYITFDISFWSTFQHLQSEFTFTGTFTYLFIFSLRFSPTFSWFSVLHQFIYFVVFFFSILLVFVVFATFAFYYQRHVSAERDFICIPCWVATFKLMFFFLIFLLKFLCNFIDSIQTWRNFFQMSVYFT